MDKTFSTGMYNCMADIAGNMDYGNLCGFTKVIIKAILPMEMGQIDK